MSAGALDGSDLERQIAQGQVIPQARSCPDKQVQHVMWDQYGIVPTNEVAVVVSCGPLRYFAKAPSYLVAPVMADRIFGLDAADAQLGNELADQLWERHGAELIAEAQRREQPRP